ncbi:caspase family protein [Actinoplanes sp. NPDC051343]|uniref:caspase, EACC1-associated type n=1 Tax=Actinoplanes sp. NPDC051343 TaxID=3363906 RepID=UPI00378A867D
MNARLGRPGVRVLLVGTGTHVAGSRLPPVPAVARTVATLRDTFVETCGVRLEAIATLVDPAGPEQFLDAVIDAAEAATDVLIVYYVGHGVQSATGELHLATHATADLARKAAYQALPFAEMSAVLATCGAGVVILVLDCCFSGRADNPVPTGALLASADRDELALAPTGEPYTAFSGSLIAALRDGIPVAPLDLRLSDIFDHVHRGMREQGRPLPLLRLGNRAYDLVIASNVAYRGLARPEEPPADGSCPYRGLEPYTADDESVFAGRSEVVDNVLRRLREAVGAGGPVMVTGPSGCGKSSVVAAGVIPAIRGGELDALLPRRAESLMITPGEDPVAALTGVGWGDPSRVVVVDQFEELFTAAVSDDDRRAFVTQLANAAGPVIICVRSDFDGHCAQYPELAAALEERNVVVGPMSTADLRAAIVEPAVRNGFDLEAGLVEILLRDVGADPGRADMADYNPGVLPLLSHALLRTWQRRSGRTLTVQGYQAVGGVAGAVAATAEDVFGQLEPAGQEAVRTMLLRMVRISEDGPDTRRRIPRSVVADTPALLSFAEARLVTLDQDTAELTHEALIRSWPRLSGWINADRSGQQERQQLTEVAAAWVQASRDPALLYRGGQLAAARARIGGLAATELSREVTEFLVASGRQERRQIRVRRAFLAALLVLVVAASGATWVAAARGARLSRQLATATAENLAASSDTQALDRPAFSARAALAAWRSDPSDPAARTALAHRYAAMRSVDRAFPDLTSEPITGMETSTDGGTAVLVHDHGVTVATGLLGEMPTVRDVPGVGDPAAELSPDGRWMAGFDTDHNLSLWDLSGHTGPFRLLDLWAKGEQLGVAFSVDSARMLISQGSRILVWLTATRAPIPVPAALSSGRNISDAWFTERDDRLLLAYGEKDTIHPALETRSLADGRLVERFPAQAKAAANGRRVLTCSIDTPPTRSLDAATGRVVGSLPVDDLCTVALTGDRGYVLDPQRGATQQQTTRVSPVTGGMSYDFVLPTVRQDLRVTDETDEALRVVQRAGAPPTMLTFSGETVLRLTALAPDWTTTLSSTAAGDGDVLLERTEDGLDSVDRTTGTLLGRVRAGTAAEGADWVLFDVSTPGLIARTGAQWQVIRFTPPRLTTRETVAVASATAGNNLEALGEGDYLVVAAGDRLSAWDFPSGRLLAGPYEIGRSAAQKAHFQNDVDLAARPGHPEIVAVSGPDEPIQLWDLHAGRVTKTVPITGTPVIDRAGDHLAILSDHIVTMWDVGRNAAEGKPFSVPDAYSLLGFTDDGYLLVDTNNSRIEIWDTTRHMLSGDLTLGSNEEPGEIDPDTGYLRLTGTGIMPAQLPLDASRWFDRLCATFRGGFTASDKELLPPGAARADPCR